MNKESGSRSWRLLLPPPTAAALEIPWYQELISQGTKALRAGSASPLISEPGPSPVPGQSPGGLAAAAAAQTKAGSVARPPPSESRQKRYDGLCSSQTDRLRGRWVTTSLMLGSNSKDFVFFLNCGKIGLNIWDSGSITVKFTPCHKDKTYLIIPI